MLRAHDDATSWRAATKAIVTSLSDGTIAAVAARLRIDPSVDARALLTDAIAATTATEVDTLRWRYAYQLAIVQRCPSDELPHLLQWIVEEAGPDRMRDFFDASRLDLRVLVLDGAAEGRSGD